MEGLRIHDASSESKDPTKEAEAQIQIILQEVAMLGANDSEIFNIREILEKIKNRLISTEEGIRQAIEIRDSKQDYH